MESIAKIRHVRVSAQKARLVADQIRGMPIQKAVNTLAFSVKKVAKDVAKVLSSAIANAEHNYGADIDELKVASIFVDEGTAFKRFSARARGRSNRILKRTCHITVVLADKGETQ